MPTKKPRCPNGSRRKPPKTGKCVKTKKRSTASQKRSFLKGIKSKSKSKTKSSNNKTKKKGNYRSFIGCEMKRLKKLHPNEKQADIMKMAAKNWNKGKIKQ